MSENRFIFFTDMTSSSGTDMKKNGLIDEFAGVRFCQSLLLPERKNLMSLQKRREAV